MPELFTTPQGLRVLVEELPHTYSVAVGAFIGAGARHEPDAHAGAAHFIEHMLFKGTARYPNARLISQAVEGVGGYLNASTSYESTVYYAKTATIHFDRALDVLAEMLQRPLFDLRELEKERRVIIEELRGLQDSPSEWVHELLQETMWGDGALGRDIAGSAETVGGLGRAELSDYFQRHYNRANTVISVAGNVRAAEVADAVAAAFAGLPEGPPADVPAPPQPRPGPRVTLHARDTEQGNFCLGLPGLAYSDRDRRALQVLDSILGGGMSSRLFQEVREERGLAYAVDAFHWPFTDTGVFGLGAGTAPEDVDELLPVALGCLRDAALAATPEELGRAQAQMKVALLTASESASSRADQLARQILAFGRPVSQEEIVARLDALTVEDIHAAGRSLLECRPVVVGLGPVAELPASTAVQTMLAER